MLFDMTSTPNFDTGAYRDGTQAGRDVWDLELPAQRDLLRAGLAQVDAWLAGFLDAVTD